MSLPAIFMLAVVLLVGVPSAIQLGGRLWVSLRNPTAAALVVAWAASEFYWLRTGDNIPTRLYFVTDLFVMLVMCLKAWTGRATGWDGAIMLIFPAMWLYYFDGQIGEYHKWYALYFLALAQFLAAGAEPFFEWLEPRLAKASATASQKPENPSSGREFRWIRGRERYA